MTSKQKQVRLDGPQSGPRPAKGDTPMYVLEARHLTKTYGEGEASVEA